MSRVDMNDYPDARAVEHVRCQLGVRDDGKESGELHRVMLTYDGRFVLLDHTEEHIDSWLGLRHQGLDLRCKCWERRWLWEYFTSGRPERKNAHALPDWLQEDLLYMRGEDEHWHKLSESWMLRQFPGTALPRRAKLGRKKAAKRDENPPEWIHTRHGPEKDRRGDTDFWWLCNLRRQDMDDAAAQIEGRTQDLFKLRMIRTLDIRSHLSRDPGLTLPSYIQDEQIEHIDISQWLATVAGRPWASASSWEDHDFMVIDAPPPELSLRSDCFPAKVLVHWGSERDILVRKRSFDIRWAWVWKLDDRWGVSLDHPYK